MLIAIVMFNFLKREGEMDQNGLDGRNSSEVGMMISLPEKISLSGCTPVFRCFVHPPPSLNAQGWDDGAAVYSHCESDS